LKDENLEKLKQQSKIYRSEVNDLLDETWVEPDFGAEIILIVTDAPTEGQLILVDFAVEAIIRCGATVLVSDINNDEVRKLLTLDLLNKKFVGIIVASTNHFAFPSGNLKSLLTQWINEGMGSTIFGCNVLFSSIIKGGSESGGGTNLHGTISSGLERFGMIKMQSDIWHYTYGCCVEKMTITKKDLRHSFVFGIKYAIATIRFLYGKYYEPLDGIENVNLSKKFHDLEKFLRSEKLKTTYENTMDDPHLIVKELKDENLELRNIVQELHNENQELQKRLEKIVKELKDENLELRNIVQELHNENQELQKKLEKNRIKC